MTKEQTVEVPESWLEPTQYWGRWTPRKTAGDFSWSRLKNEKFLVAAPTLEDLRALKYVGINRYEERQGSLEDFFREVRRIGCEGVAIIENGRVTRRIPV